MCQVRNHLTSGLRLLLLLLTVWSVGLSLIEEAGLGYSFNREIFCEHTLSDSDNACRGSASKDESISKLCGDYCQHLDFYCSCGLATGGWHKYIHQCEPEHCMLLQASF